MNSRKIFTLFSFVFLFGLFTTSYVPVCVAGEKMDQFKAFVKSIPGQLKEKIKAIDYDNSEGLDLVFSTNIKGKTIKVGVEIPWEPAAGNLSKGFPLTPIQIISPSLGDVVSSSIIPGNIKKLRVLHILLGIGTKDERNAAKADIVKNVTDPVKDALKPIFEKFAKMIFIHQKTKNPYLKPMHIFFSKLMILFKSYGSTRRGEIPGQLRLLFLRLLQSVNVDKTIAANNGEMNPGSWKKKVFMSDPSSIVDILPDSLKRILTSINVSVLAADYQDYLDFNREEKNSESGYRYKISEVFKRNDGNSRMIASIREIQPLFEKKELLSFDAALLAYICGTLVRNKSKITEDILVERLGEFLNDAKSAISNMEVEVKLKGWRDSLVFYVDGLINIVKNDGKLEKDPVFSELVIPGTEKVSLIPAVSYYFSKIKSIMNTRFSGDDGSLFMDYRIGQKKALYLMSIVLFRVYKDYRAAFKKENITKELKDKREQTIGSRGTYSYGKWKKSGTGLIFESQKAAIKYKKNKTVANGKAFAKAKSALVTAQTNFKLWVINKFSFKRATNIGEETIRNFLLREIKGISLRCDRITLVIEAINNASKELLGVPLIENESKFEEEIEAEEPGDEFGFEEDFDEDDFAF